MIFWLRCLRELKGLWLSEWEDERLGRREQEEGSREYERVLSV